MNAQVERLAHRLRASHTRLVNRVERLANRLRGLHKGPEVSEQVERLGAVPGHSRRSQLDGHSRRP